MLLQIPWWLNPVSGNHLEIGNSVHFLGIDWILWINLQKNDRLYWQKIHLWNNCRGKVQLNCINYFLLEHIDNHIVISCCSVVLCFASFCRWYNNHYLTFPSVISQIFVPKQKKLAAKWITSVLKKKEKKSFCLQIGLLGMLHMYVYPDQEVTLRKKWHRLLIIIINNSSISWNEGTYQYYC